MTLTAIVMMIIAILVVWGGLAVAIAFLVRNPLDEHVAQEEWSEDYGEHHL